MLFLNGFGTEKIDKVFSKKYSPLNLFLRFICFNTHIQAMVLEINLLKRETL